MKIISIINVSVNSNWVHPPPPGNPGEKFFERANPGHPGKLFCLIPCPGAKNYCRIHRGWGKIFPNSKKLLRIKLAKVLKKLRRLRDSKTTRKSLNTPALIFNSNKEYMNNWCVECRCPLRDSFVKSLACIKFLQMIIFPESPQILG